MLGYSIVGKGKTPVLMLHDWFSDTSSYDFVRSMLDPQTYTYCFVDLRGYGLSQDLIGEYTVEEIWSDLVKVVDHLGWSRFHLVGHSMTGLVVQYAMGVAASRLISCLAAGPTPAHGLSLPEENMAFMQDAAASNDEGARGVIDFMTSSLYKSSFVDFKVRRWRETATAEARVAYLHMFSSTNIVEQVRGASTPLLIITGQQDGEMARLLPTKEAFDSLFKNVRYVDLENCGHYPMQERPATYVEVLEDFLKSSQDA